MKKSVWVLVALILCASPAAAQWNFAVTKPDVGVPKFVANATVTGYLGLYPAADTLQDNPRFTIFQITATSDCTFNFWKYLPDDDAWSMDYPEFGETAADTVYTLVSGQTETYRFPSGINQIPSAIYVGSGTLVVKAE